MIVNWRSFPQISTDSLDVIQKIGLAQKHKIYVEESPVSICDLKKKERVTRERKPATFHQDYFVAPH